jgi:uncharacterized membrane protein
MDASVGTAPRWAVIASGVLSLIGLGIATYLTIAHFVGVQALACSANSIVNCEVVTTSAQSTILGVPVAVLGLCYFVVAVPFYSPWAWRSPRRIVHVIRLVGAISGMVFVLWLIAAEMLIIGKICLWCSGVHLTTFALFVITMATVPTMLQGDQD